MTLSILFFLIFKMSFIFDCAGASLLCMASRVAASRGYSLVVVLGLLIARARALEQAGSSNRGAGA